MIGHRQQRILAVLADHPAGLAAENLLAALASCSPRAERHRMIMSIHALAAGGWISIAGKRCVPSALVASVRMPTAA
jgi:hypothetical protein